MASAIKSADNSYFNEDYTKQATAALAAIEKAGFTVLPKEYPAETWKKVADNMKTGRVKPEEHVKNVYETVLTVVSSTK
jgi:hypothetical protein